MEELKKKEILKKNVLILKKPEEKCIWNKLLKKKKKIDNKTQKNMKLKNLLPCSEKMGKLDNVMKENLNLN